MNSKYIALLTLVLLTACSSRPIIPNAEKLKLAWESPAKDCRDLGPVIGRTLNRTGNLKEEAVKDLRENAVRKGANFVWLKAFGPMDTTVEGIAYDCP